MTANDAVLISLELIQECTCIHRSLGGKPPDKQKKHVSSFDSVPYDIHESEDNDKAI